MSTSQASSGPASALRDVGTIDLKLEVVVIPVADVDRARRFYEGLGWRLDADFARGEDWRVVQMTPPGSQCSIHFGKGITGALPGSIQNMYLIVDDLEAARAYLIGHGAEVSEIFHVEGEHGRTRGRDPEGRSYFSFATFSDPDGNSWLLQEIRTRLPGRGLSRDVATLTQLLRETEIRHGEFGSTVPAHHWSEWYAAYMVAREQGSTPDDAVGIAARHIDGTSR